MKTVIVAGFFDPVLKALNTAYADQLKAGVIVWVGQIASGRELNLNDFKSHLFDKLATGAKQILIVIAVLRGKEWAEERVKAIVTNAQKQYPDSYIRFQTDTSAQNSSRVLSEIAAFGLSPPPELSMEQIIEKLQGEKILCVRLDGRQGFQTSLERAGFPKDAYSNHFIELVIPGGRNSNLIQMLNGKAKSFGHLIYAWQGLRTLPPAVKSAYSGVVFEASSPFEVVLLLKRWILG